jgi:hypothetical protein
MAADEPPLAGLTGHEQPNNRVINEGAPTRPRDDRLQGSIKSDNRPTRFASPPLRNASHRRPCWLSMPMMSRRRGLHRGGAARPDHRCVQRGGWEWRRRPLMSMSLVSQRRCYRVMSPCARSVAEPAGHTIAAWESCWIATRAVIPARRCACATQPAVHATSELVGEAKLSTRQGVRLACPRRRRSCCAGQLLGH